MEQPSTTDITEIAKSKPGPKAKPKVDVAALQDTVDRLTNLVIRMAHQTGTSRAIIIENGFANFEPQKQHMHRAS